MTPRLAAGGLVELKLGHYRKDGIEVVTVEGEIEIYTAPRLRELLIDLAGKGTCRLVVNLDKVGFLDSSGLGVLVGGLKRVRPHDGSLDLVCTQQRILTGVPGTWTGVRAGCDAGRGRSGFVAPRAGLCAIRGRVLSA